MNIIFDFCWSEFEEQGEICLRNYYIFIYNISVNHLDSVIKLLPYDLLYRTQNYLNASEENKIIIEIQEW